jgi:hypothetical protein
MWNPANVMNYQTNPNFPNSMQKSSISLSVIPAADQLNDGDKL